MCYSSVDEDILPTGNGRTYEKGNTSSPHNVQNAPLWLIDKFKHLDMYAPNYFDTTVNSQLSFSGLHDNPINLNISTPLKLV